jgi:hypothetical protein
MVTENFQSVTGFPPRWHEFDPRSGYRGYVVDKLALGAYFAQVLRFPLPVLTLHTP